MKKAFWVIGSIVILILLLWYFASPLVLNREVNEPFLVSQEGELAEALPEEDRGTLVEVQTNVAVMPNTTTAEEMPDTVAEDAPTNGSSPTLVAEGDFMDADSFHQGSGMARVYELEGGARVLRFENFMVTNGPDLHVLLAENLEPSGSDDLGEYVDLGELKGNRGNQNYEIPAGIGAHSYNSVVIYCKPFHVVFSVATLLTINYSTESPQQ